MAFGLVAAGTAYDSAGSTGGAAGAPSGVADGDILFTLIKRITDTDPTTSPSGWTLLGKDITTGGSGHWLYYKIAASEPADYTWGWAGSQRTGIQVIAYRDGFDTADPIDVVSNTSYETSNNNARAASISAAAANSPLIYFGNFHTSSSRTWTAPASPAGFAEDLDAYGGGARWAREVASQVLAASGATGDMDGVFSGAVDTNKHAFAVILNPASGGISASLAATLGAITPTATAQIRINGRVAGTLGNTTLAATGRVSTAARLAGTLGDTTLASAFTITNGEITATLTQTLGSMTLQAAAQVRVNGRLIQTLGDMTLQAGAAARISARLQQTLGALTLAAHATQGGITASLTGTLGNTTLAATARLQTGARLEQTLGNLTVAGQARVDIRAALAATLGNLTLEAATQPGGREAQLTATLGDLTLSAAVDTGYEAPAVDTPATGGGVLPVRYRNRLKPPTTQPQTPVELVARITEEPDQAFLTVEILPMVVRARVLERGDQTAGRLEVLAAIETRATEEVDWVRGHMEADWKHDDEDIARADLLLFGEAA